MRTINYFRLRLKELRGALGDLGTLLPLMVALILVAVLGTTFAVGCEGKSSTTTTPLGQVTFHDSNLEASVHEALNISRRPIYMSDLKFLTTLTAYKRNISDLAGLEYCENLKMLDLGYNNISDISALAGLTNLTALLLGQNNISDVSALAGLTNLEWLSLEQNNISDISALVANNGLSAGDIVQFQNNPLSTTSLNTYVPRLREKGVILSPLRCGT